MTTFTKIATLSVIVSVTISQSDIEPTVEFILSTADYWKRLSAEAWFTIRKRIGQPTKIIDDYYCGGTRYWRAEYTIDEATADSLAEATKG